MTHDELLYGIKEIERLAEGMWGTKALRAVVELHKPDSNYCDACEWQHAYPCPTIQKIMDELK